MSTPHLQFSQLSITSMQASKSTQNRQPTGKGKGRALPNSNLSTEEGESEEEEEDHDDNDNEEESGSEDDSDTDSDSDETTEVSPVFALDHCRQIGSTYAFQLGYAEVKRFSIRVKASGSGMPECSCREESACKHVHWLLEQLARTRTNGNMDPSIAPYEQINALGLENVCQRLDWEIGQEGQSEYVEYQLLKKNPPKPVPVSQASGERVSAICDLLATLSPDKLAENIRAQIFPLNEQPLDFNSNNLLAPRDLETTVARMLFVNDEMFQQIYSIVPASVRASEYFRKMAMKAHEVCGLMDRFCNDGPDGSGVDHTVIWCAKQLVLIVDSIQQNITARQPLPLSSREDAASALVSILKLVVGKNAEAYQPNLQRNRRHGEPLSERNLYLRLIGVESEDNPSSGAFVLEALQDLPEAKRHVEELGEIYRKITSVGWKAPLQSYYSEKLRGLISRLGGETVAPEPSRKRVAGSLDGNVKRMK